MLVRVSICLILSLSVLFWPPVSLAADNPPGDAIVLPPLLPDQHGELGGLQNQPQALQLVIVVSAKRLRRLKPWERELRERYPDLDLLRVADVPVSGSASVDDVAGKLRKRLPENVDVLIDLDGAWAQRYALDVSVPNLLLFAANRSLIAQHAGFYQRQRFDMLAGDIDEAMDEAMNRADPAATISAQASTP